MDATLTTILGTDLVGGAITLQPHEAVAVVLQLAETVSRLGVACVPDLAHIRLSADGTVSILEGAEWADAPVTYLAAVLRLLLKGPAADPQLAAAVGQAVDQSWPGGTDIDRFVKALAACERPNRRAVLHDVVERAATTLSAPVDQGTEELDKARVEVHKAPAGARPDAGSFRPRYRPRLPFIGLVVAMLLGAALGTWRASRSASKHVTVAPGNVATAPSPTPPVVPADIRSSASTTVAVTRVEPGAEPDRVYSRMDGAVTPPVPLPPLIGRIVSDGSAVSGDMDVLVGTTGDVERVTPVVPEKSAHEQMLIDALKKGRFTPARANDRPVRYLIRVRTSS